MINRIPNFFELVATATRNVIPHYSGLRLGNGPGQFTLNNQNNPSPNQNLQGANVGMMQPVVSVQIVSSEQLPPNFSNLLGGNNIPLNNPVPNNNNSSQQQQQQQNQLLNSFSSSLNQMLPGLQGLIGNFMPGLQVPQQQQPQQSQPQGQQQQAPVSQPVSSPPQQPPAQNQ